MLCSILTDTFRKYEFTEKHLFDVPGYYMVSHPGRQYASFALSFNTRAIHKVTSGELLKKNKQ
jgi:hypothetical protein